MKTAETVSVCRSDCATSLTEVGLIPLSSFDDDSDDDVSQCVAENSTYKSLMCVVADDEWVVVNSDSGLLSLLTLLQQKMDAADTQIQSNMVDASGSVVCETTMAMLPSTPSSLEDMHCAPIEDLGHSDISLPEAGESSESMHNEEPIQIQPLDDIPLSLVEKNSESMHFEEPIQFPTVEEISQPIIEVDSNPFAMIQQLHQELQKPGIATVVLPDAHLIQFLDSGGQLAYHDILPIFVNIPAIYLHVFNVAKELTECLVDELCSAGGRRMFSAKSALSVADMITRSAMTVQSLAGKKVRLPQEVNCESKLSKPHIVLVGTHLDKLEQDEEDPSMKLMAINETLCTALRSKLHDLEGMVVTNTKCHYMFFPVNNKHQPGKHCKCKHCRAVNRLKKEITKQAMEDAVKVEVPVKWYLWQLLELSQGQEKPLHSYCELYQQCKEEGSVADIGEFHAMVTYFHALGILVHLCEADVGHTEDSDCLIFTNPSYLFENISKLYQVQFEKSGTQAKITLKHEGKLTKEALRDLKVDEGQLDYDRFMNLLVQLFIGAEVKSDEGVRTLFVPSVLTNPEDAVAIGARPLEQFLCLAITFKGTSYIPCGVFTGVAARLQSAPEWKIRTRSSSRMCMEFAVGTEATVTLCDHATHVSMKVDRCDGIRLEEYQEYCSTVVKATADSYCFLFHSKAAKDPHDGTCCECRDSPYLILGQTCQMCPTQSSATPKTPHFAELKMKKGVPWSVRCHDTDKPKVLSEFEQVTFQNISHYVSDWFAIHCSHRSPLRL